MPSSALLAYKQEPTCHARLITTASTYLRLLIFDISHLDDYQKSKLINLISYIISVYVPSFLLIYLKPSAAEGSRIIFFQHDLLLAYREIDSELADVVLKYFYERAVQRMLPVNVALSVFKEASPYSIEAVKTSHYPDSIHARKLLQGRKAGLRYFLQVREEPLLALYAPRYQWHIGKLSKITTQLLKG